ncbi:hypothetical protein PoHVEF18_000221 [Penicillium ochrochloron]
MTPTDHLALLDLSGNRDPATITNLREALLRYGAFRLRAPELKKAIPLTGTPVLDEEFLGFNFYDPQQLDEDTSEYNPPHMDTGTLMILFRDDSAEDGLEVADLRSTDKFGSNDVGQEAVFLRVPGNPDEVIVLAGTRLQRLLGKDKVRAC